MKTFLVILLLAISLRCGADYYQIGPLPSSVPKSDTMSALKARNLRWQTEKWTGSDAPFITAGDRIEASLKAGATIEALLDNAEAEAIQKPYDAAAQFAWCYIAYKAVTTFKLPDGRNPKFVRLGQRLTNSTQGMVYGTQPHSYVYSRLLFLARAKDGDGQDFMTIGHRLMMRNREDDELRRVLIRIDTDSFYPPRTQEALGYANYLYRESPDSPKLYFLLGNIHFGEFLTYKKHEDADEAIANWHKSFQLSPPSKPILEVVHDNIKWINKVEARQAKGG